MRHADDHIHIAVVLVREDTGRRFWPHHDYRGLRRTARELESELGLTPTVPAASQTAARRPQRAELEIAARQGVEPSRTELTRVVREAAVAARDPDGFLELLRGRGYLVELRRLPSGDPIGYKITRKSATPVWFSGGRLAPDLSMPKLITRWDKLGNAIARPAAGELAETRQTLKRAERIVRGARRGIAAESPDGIAHAVGDVFAGLGARYGGSLCEAARCYDRAARAPYDPVPQVGPVGLELRALAGHLLRRPRQRHGNDLDVLSTVVLLVALTALVQQVGERRAEQGHRYQATAAQGAARLVRSAAGELRRRPPPPWLRRVPEVGVPRPIRSPL